MILQFIKEIRNSHSQMINIFTQGSCYNFHLILKCVYPQAIPYYDINHIISLIDGEFYDINGIVEFPDKYMPLNECYNQEGVDRAIDEMYNFEFNLKKIHRS